MLSLTGCASDSPQRVVITQREPVLPPEQYLVPCEIDVGEGTVAEVLTGLRAGIDCERADKAAIRAWASSFSEPDSEPLEAAEGGSVAAQ